MVGGDCTLILSQSEKFEMFFKTLQIYQSFYGFQNLTSFQNRYKLHKMFDLTHVPLHLNLTLNICASNYKTKAMKLEKVFSCQLRRL